MTILPIIIITLNVIQKFHKKNQLSTSGGNCIQVSIRARLSWRRSGNNFINGNLIEA